MSPPSGVPADAAGPAPRTLAIHASNPEIGGAEASLLAAVAKACSASGSRAEAPVPLFLVPAEGSLSRAASARGWAFKVLPWPRGLAGLTQRAWFALPLVIPGLIPYLFRLHGELRSAGTVWSSGVKSHGACLLLAPWLGPRLLFDVRDFLRPLKLRKAIAWASRRFGCKVSANSRAVAADFPGAEVRYPEVSLQRAAMDGSRHPGGRAPGAGGKRIITHLAYFAPYKGQDLFLTCARKLLDAGVDAEFWMIGDVIYPAEAYARYRERIYGIAGKLKLSAHVRFLGKVDGDEVQGLLEKTDLLLHCTREPEPYGRAVMEALLCGCDAVCHKGSGVAEVTEAAEFEAWMEPLKGILGGDYIRVRLKRERAVVPAPGLS